ncbi:hypothetical protein Cgig2_001965 [Carnegiea gigantea]|uniref:Uncharacterized protein n=1 Tax=Carnegiea gigantea TaxID=171969 RepID=A0A9Q1JVK1_9CARY|nr:hypothetical protein Cgig2_001965 [Carnegiea gigantea]
MVFPRSLTTDEIALYVFKNFGWYRREVVFPSLPLPYDYKDLYLDFDLIATKEAVWDFHLLEIPQVVFFVMLLNDAVKMGVLRRWMITIMESTLKELRWSTFEDAKGTTSCTAAVQRWTATRKRQNLYPAFTLSDVEDAARDFNIPKTAQAIFYAMVVNDALELDVMSRDMAGTFKSTLQGLWINKHTLLRAELCRQANPRVGPELASGQEQNLEESTAPPPSNDDK